MEMIVENVVVTVCGTDPQLGSEWYELLGRSAPSADDAEWTELVGRIRQVATDTGLDPDGLMEALVVQDTVELRTAVAAVVWPDSADDGYETETDAGVEAAAGSYETETDAGPAEPVEDENAWNAYLLTNGPSWDGTEENWAAFVEWFVYHANEQGVGTFARTFCDYAAANGALAVFAQYGVALAGTEPAVQEQPPQEPAPAETEPSAAGQEPAMTVEDAVATYGTEIIAEFRAANPQFADMTDDDIEAVLTEALNGQAAMAAPNAQ